MPQLVGFGPKDRDTTLVVAVRDSPGTISDGVVYRARLSRDPIERSGETLAGAISRVKPAARAVVAALTDLHRRRNEVAVTSVMELPGSADAIIATTAATAAISITLTWRVSPAMPVGGAGTSHGNSKL
jgi:hypothetical protein